MMPTPWVWVALMLSLLMIGYVVASHVVIRQATTLWGWGLKTKRK
jgi:hypothetical protein